ncbi:MAG: hypothetical protein GXO85_07285 [Chlorobi bacterium]|nr:hypothetical protein [Chlorobiota bacterium]
MFKTHLIILAITSLLFFVACSENSTEPKDDIKQNTNVSGTVTDIEGNVYKTVKIGSQWWMAENLKVTKYRNNETISKITDNSEWQNLSTGAFCSYENDDANIKVYGLLYNWFAVKRDLAPKGWHIPSDDDWKELEMYLGMSRASVDTIFQRGSDEGGKLKETGTTYWQSPNKGATNEINFSALPAGFRSRFGQFGYIGASSTFWSSTAYNINDPWLRTLGNTVSTILRERVYGQNGSGYSVRCVKDR